MPREYDEQTRKPPARKMTPDGMEERSDNLGDTDRDKTDLRASNQRFELGRNPRGAPISVNEAITRYKEVQARKFSEHITKPQEPQPPGTVNAEQRQTSDTGYPPSFTQHEDNRARDISLTAETPTTQQTDETPRPFSFSEARAEYREKERFTPSVFDSTEQNNKSGSASRLRFEEQTEELRETKTPDISTVPAVIADSERRSN